MLALEKDKLLIQDRINRMKPGLRVTDRQVGNLEPV